MNLRILQDRIINLGTTTCIRRLNPGDLRPFFSVPAQRISKHTIWIEFASPGGDSNNFDSIAEVFEYSDAKAADEDWHHLCELAGRS